MRRSAARSGTCRGTSRRRTRHGRGAREAESGAQRRRPAGPVVAGGRLLRAEELSGAGPRAREQDRGAPARCDSIPGARGGGARAGGLGRPRGSSAPFGGALRVDRGQLPRGLFVPPAGVGCAAVRRLPEPDRRRRVPLRVSATDAARLWRSRSGRGSAASAWPLGRRPPRGSRFDDGRHHAGRQTPPREPPPRRCSPPDRGKAASAPSHAWRGRPPRPRVYPARRLGARPPGRAGRPPATPPWRRPAPATRDSPSARAEETR